MKTILDLPVPYEPVEVDLSLPLEDQLQGDYLKAAKDMLDKLSKPLALGMRNK